MQRRKGLSGLVFGFFVGSGALPAEAESLDDETEEPEADPERAAPSAEPNDPERNWYGWQTLASDGLALGIIVASFTINGDGKNGITLAGAGVWALGTPMIHVAHARYWPALGSLSLRVGLPVLTYAFASQDCSGECGIIVLGTLALLPLAILGPPAFDAAYWAWEPAEESRRTAYLSGLRSLRPTFALGRDRAVFGLSGNL